MGKLQLAWNMPDGRVNERWVEADESVLIGKAELCDIALDVRGVSRKHCRIEASEQGWVVIDLHSTNGFAINGKLQKSSKEKGVASSFLQSGDELQIGEAKFVVRLHDNNPYRTEIVNLADLNIGAIGRCFYWENPRVFAGR